MGDTFIRQNKLLALAITMPFILFAVILFNGANHFYRQEYKKIHERVEARLDTATRIVKILFSDLRDDLFFLKNLAGMQKFIDGDFALDEHHGEFEELFSEFAKANPQYYQIQIIDASGDERARVDNDGNNITRIIPSAELKNRKQRFYFMQAMTLARDQVYISEIDFNIEPGQTKDAHIRTISMATPLFNSKGERKGVLNFNVYFTKILDLLPEETFVQTGFEGEVPFVFDKPRGEEHLSNVESIYYERLKILSDKELTIAVFDRHPNFSRILFMLIVFCLVAAALFLIFIMIIYHLNISRFKGIIEAEKTIILSLAGLVEWKDIGTAHHLDRTRSYAVVLSKALRRDPKYRKLITDQFLDDMYYAAPLHDIGKIGVPDAILLKESSLTPEETEKMRTHVLIGKEVLQKVIDQFQLRQSFFLIARNVCEYHHEKFNGTGYPKGLKQNEIPLEARIFALCDAYDAIRSKRPYKGELPHKEAIIRITADRGDHFDPDVVDAFLKSEQEFQNIYDSFGK